MYRAASTLQLDCASGVRPTQPVHAHLAPRRHFDRSRSSKLHGARATLPRVTKEQRRLHMRRASHAYRDRALFNRRKAKVIRESLWRFLDKPGHANVMLTCRLPSACRASILEPGHQMGLVSLDPLDSWQALYVLSRKAHNSRTKVLLRLHPDKLASVSMEECPASEEAFKKMHRKMQQGVFWFQDESKGRDRSICHGWPSMKRQPTKARRGRTLMRRIRGLAQPTACLRTSIPV